MTHIARLDPLVARRIAAGEVVDRPSSVVRELVDNAIDAKPTHITLSIDAGGIDRITVIDDGSGIAPEDLPLACESHATSKIHSLDDLYQIRTMGFRGEALSSISAVSRTTIASALPEKDPFSIIVDNGDVHEVTPGGPLKGTTVTVEDLFLHLPARRQFLKRPSTEAQRCREVFIEKALSEPQIAFTMVSDGTQVIDLAKAERVQRVLDVLALDTNIEPGEMQALELKAERFSLYAVCSSQAMYRSDKSGIRIFVNNRPVDEYSMVQAVTYGYGELLPGGAFPYCYLFIQDDPTLVDFNIHPTKREVKIRNKAEVHHGVTTMLRSQLKRVVPSLVADVRQDELPVANPIAKEDKPYEPHGYQSSFPREQHSASSAHDSTFKPLYDEKKPIDPMWFSKAKEILGEAKKEDMRTDKSVQTGLVWQPEAAEDSFTYVGQAFNLFLICEKGDELYLIDQHAAHERILFNAIKEKKDVQKLLVPTPFDVDADVDAYLEQNQDVYVNLGIALERKGPGSWLLLSLPALFKNIEPKVIEFIQKETGDAVEVEKGLYAVVACHKAIKQGDPLDRVTATELCRKVFQLEEPVCPHGRTFVVRLKKDELMAAVGRVV